MGFNSGFKGLNPCRLRPDKHSKQVPTKQKSGALMLDLLLVIIVIIIIIIIISSVSPLCRVSTLIFLRQTMSLGNTVLQLF